MVVLSPMVLIIGYGNPLRSDDGLGWHIAQRLLEDLHDPQVQVLACHQLTPELAEPLSRARRVVFIDARAGSPPGEIAVAPVRPATTLPTTFSHHLSPAELLACAQQLYAAVPEEALLVSVTAASFAYGESLTPAVAAVVSELLERVKKFDFYFGPPQHFG